MKDITISLELASEAATFALGEHIAQLCNTGAVLYLTGELGAGKTTFARGFLHGRGYFGKVKSPTYTLVEPYPCAEGKVFHLDLYRLQAPEELEFLGIRDYLDPHDIVMIEWPVLGKGYLPEPTLKVNIDFSDEGRRVYLESVGLVGHELLSKFEPRNSYRKVNIG